MNIMNEVEPFKGITKYDHHVNCYKFAYQYLKQKMIVLLSSNNMVDVL